MSDLAATAIMATFAAVGAFGLALPYVLHVRTTRAMRIRHSRERREQIQEGLHRLDTALRRGGEG